MRNPTLLVVDSCDRARSAVGDVLRWSGYEVLEAQDGVGGLQVARRLGADLVIAEVWPFFCATLQMMELLRSGRDTAHVPVLVLTSASSPEYRQRAQDAGCAAYLEKPCAPESLIAEVRRLANRPSAAARVAVRDARHR